MDHSVVIEMNLAVLDKCWHRTVPSICQWRQVVCECCIFAWTTVLYGPQWSDFITNAEVYTRPGLQSIQSIVRRRRLSLFGHVARMPDNVPARAVLRMACDVRDGVPPYPNWRISRGRPPITWLHQICSDCCLSAGDALNCTQYRDVWRTYATASSASR